MAPHVLFQVQSLDNQKSTYAGSSQKVLSQIPFHTVSAFFLLPPLVTHIKCGFSLLVISFNMFSTVSTFIGVLFHCQMRSNMEDHSAGFLFWTHLFLFPKIGCSCFKERDSLARAQHLLLLSVRQFCTLFKQNVVEIYNKVANHSSRIHTDSRKDDATKIQIHHYA